MSTLYPISEKSLTYVFYHSQPVFITYTDLDRANTDSQDVVFLLFIVILLYSGSANFIARSMALIFKIYEVYRRLARHSPRAEANYAIQYNTVPCNTIYKVIKYTKYHL